jgi:magnesium transporter
MAEERAEEYEREEEDYRLDGEVVDQILEAVAAEDAPRLAALMEPLHAADIADLLEQIGGAERRGILRLWGREIDGEILTEIDESIREEVIDAMPREVLAEAVRELDSDDVVDLIEDLEEPQQEAILEALDDTDRAAVEQSLAYPEYSAGRLMQREVVMAPEHWTVGEAIDHMRKNKADLPEQFYHVILVDPRMKPTGYVTLGKILSSKRAVPLTSIVEDSFRTISVYQEEADVAYAFNQYHLISAAVVDENDRLVGIITIDDAMAVLDEEHEEDILRLAGVGDESAISDTVLETVRQRLPWLAVNLMTAILASGVIALFEGTIERLVALAVLMRALATKDLTESNVWRVVRREAVVGLLNGLAFALVMGAVAWVWFDTASLGLVIGAAMVINLFVAAVAGIVVPLSLEKLGADPALASGTFVTTVTDVVGFFAFLGLAGALLL